MAHLSKDFCDNEVVGIMTLRNKSWELQNYSEGERAQNMKHLEAEIQAEATFHQRKQGAELELISGNASNHDTWRTFLESFTESLSGQCHLSSKEAHIYDFVNIILCITTKAVRGYPAAVILVILSSSYSSHYLVDLLCLLLLHYLEAH